jgi:hypothetical protein
MGTDKAGGRQCGVIYARKDAYAPVHCVWVGWVRVRCGGMTAGCCGWSKQQVVARSRWWRAAGGGMQQVVACSRWWHAGAHHEDDALRQGPYLRKGLLQLHLVKLTVRQQAGQHAALQQAQHPRRAVLVEASPGSLRVQHMIGLASALHAITGGRSALRMSGNSGCSMREKLYLLAAGYLQDP